MHVTAIIAAGGRGQRFGGAQPKQLLAVGGRPILERSVAAFLSHPAIDAVVVALPQALVDDPPAYLRSADGLAPGGSGKPLRLIAGGERRQDSVANAFRAADAASDLIVIHDAARPFASADLITRTIAAAAETGAALAAMQARDTVKRAADSPAEAGRHLHAADRPAEAGRHLHAADSPAEAAHPPHTVGSGFSRTVAETLPRETIYLAQTPQAFRRDVLAAALALADDATDEAALAERAGHAVRLVDGEATNIKITTPEDLAIADAIAATLRIADCGLRSDDGGPAGAESAIRNQSAIRNPQSAVSLPARTGRAGTGYDLHRLVEGRPLILGGVSIPSDRGALGHSDADVVCHAVTDAILGAACLGDIGRHFPESDPRWKGASSLDLLRRVVAIVAEEGLAVGNVDVTVILERPKIQDHIGAMRAAVAQAIGIDPGRVSIKGKTNEGVDAIGRGEAIAAHAIALIRAI
jgi:2-C-methyl-D-erythritol 4-phosphate cytidylyltransferase/2-C-methyl-D-erythritol 2,4-cyclodiphosphate synthase